jgi:hypothetical protein
MISWFRYLESEYTIMYKCDANFNLAKYFMSTTTLLNTTSLAPEEMLAWITPPPDWLWKWGQNMDGATLYVDTFITDTGTAVGVINRRSI